MVFVVTVNRSNILNYNISNGNSTNILHSKKKNKSNNSTAIIVLLKPSCFGLTPIFTEAEAKGRTKSTTLSGSPSLLPHMTDAFDEAARLGFSSSADYEPYLLVKTTSICNKNNSNNNDDDNNADAVAVRCLVGLVAVVCSLC